MSHAANQNADSLGMGALNPATVAAEAAKPSNIAKACAELTEAQARLSELGLPRLWNVTEADVQRAVALAREMFRGDPLLVITCDPEDPDYPFLVVKVPWRGTPRDFIAKSLAWHTRMSESCPGTFGGVRLSVSHFE